MLQKITHNQPNKTFTLQRKSYIIRFMEFKDIDRVYQLEQETFSLAWSKNSFIWEVTQNKNSYSFVVQKESEIIAYMINWLIENEIHIANLAVKKKYQRHKIATLLLQEILSRAKEKGIQVAHLEVRKSNIAAIALYKKFNFNIVGIRKNYYASEHEDALLMSCPLDKLQNVL